MDVRVGVRLADALTAVALATDAGKGAPLEKSLRTAVIATRLGTAAGLRGEELSTVYYVALLRSLGCTAYAPETAACSAATTSHSTACGTNWIPAIRPSSCTTSSPGWARGRGRRCGRDRSRGS
jgi:hypothetical protein